MIMILLILRPAITTTLLVPVMIVLNTLPLLTARIVAIAIMIVIVLLVSVSVHRCTHIVGTL